MNNKGFTMVELLATIGVLAIVITIAVPSVISVSKQIKNNMYKARIKLIESNAKLCVEDGKCTPSGTGDRLYLGTIKGKGYLKKEDLINPINNKPMDDCYVTITKSGERVSASFFETLGIGDGACQSNWLMI